MKTLLAILLFFGVSVPAGLADPTPSGDYSKLILGRWLGSKKYEIYYADGTWAVQKNEDAKPDKEGRRWKIDGNKLTSTSPDGGGTETIVTLTKDKFVTEANGAVDERTRAPQ